MRARAWPTAAAVLALAGCLLAGCSSGQASAPAEGDDGADRSDMPPIHVVQEHWQVLKGQPARESAYRQALASCQAHNPGATVPLPGDIAGKLGHKRVEYWAQGSRQATREENWDWEFDHGRGCRFKPVREAQLALDDGHTLLLIDLDKHTAEREPSEPPAPGAPIDDEAIADAAQDGLRYLGKQSAAGQPCRAWEAGPQRPDAGYRTCYWAGGERWGIGGIGVEDDDSSDPFVLWSRPADGRNGWVYQVKSMTVGEPIDQDVFSPPSGIRIADADPDATSPNG